MKVRFTLNGRAQVKTAQDMHMAIEALERLGISVDTLKVDPAGFDSSGSFLTDSYSYRQIRLPQHLRKMIGLSHAARKVLDAYTEDNELHDWKHLHSEPDALAAALRAAAKQVMPEPGSPGTWPAYQHLMQLADELEQWGNQPQ